MFIVTLVAVFADARGAAPSTWPSNPVASEVSFAMGSEAAGAIDTVTVGG